MRLTSWNFLHGQLLEPEAGDHALREVLNLLDSDVLALQEVDYKQERSGNIDQTAEIADAIGASAFRFAATLSGTPGLRWRKLHKREREIESAAVTSEPRYGISIVSKIPVLQWERKELGRSLIGMPLAIAGENGKFKFIYVRDEPRVALAAVLENGWTVINTHLSFVPIFNIYQLFKLSRWARTIEKKHSTQVILVGDFNLPWGIPSKLTCFKRATHSLTYPSWAPKVSFDYIMTRDENLISFKEVLIPRVAISDHRPLSVDLQRAQ